MARCVQTPYPVDLLPAQRTVPKEGTYFAVALVISIVVWLGLLAVVLIAIGGLSILYHGLRAS